MESWLRPVGRARLHNSTDVLHAVHPFCQSGQRGARNQGSIFDSNCTGCHQRNETNWTVARSCHSSTSQPITSHATHCIPFISMPIAAVRLPPFQLCISHGYRVLCPPICPCVPVLTAERCMHVNRVTACSHQARMLCARAMTTSSRLILFPEMQSNISKNAKR